MDFPLWLEFDRDENVWVTHVPVLGDLSTFGSTQAEALERTREAIRGYIIAAQREGIELPAKVPPIETATVDVVV